MGPAPAEGRRYYDLIDAGKQPVTLLHGGASFTTPTAFGMMRGGHLEVSALGAFQASATADLANWHTGAPDAIPGVGGAMDQATGARRTPHVDQDGARCQSRRTEARACLQLPTARQHRLG